MDEELKKEIINCSRCGLCMEVCPVYKVKQTENTVSRGKFLQILGLIKKDLKYDKTLKYSMDLCLNCKKCRRACPSDIDAVKIFASVKNEFQTPSDKFLNSNFIFKLKMFSLKMLYKIKYPAGKNFFVKKSFQNKAQKEKIAHFNGCLSRAINNKFQIPARFKKEKFFCCGIPFYVKGNFKEFEKCKKKNLKLFEKYDKIVFDCATCYDTVLNYEGINKEKIVYFTEFYKNKELTAAKKIKNGLKITFHKPCHLNDKTFFEIEEILSNIKGINYQRMENFDDCCGFGGDFFTRHINTASKLSLKKVESAIETGSDIILTTCPTCLWSLKFGIKLKGAKIKAFDLQEFLYNFVDIKRA